MQYPLGIPPNLRTNIDYVFILREPYLTNRKRIWENYASMFPTLESFCAVMDQTTENYECLVISNNAKSNKLNDQVFWYKASTDVNYKMCSKELWQMQERNDEMEALGYKKDDDGEDEEYDNELVIRKTKGNKGVDIKVKKSHQF